MAIRRGPCASLPFALIQGRQGSKQMCVDVLVSTQSLPEHVGSDAQLLGSMWDPALPRPLIPRVDCVGDLLKDHGVIGEEQLQQWGGGGGRRAADAGHIRHMPHFVRALRTAQLQCHQNLNERQQDFSLPNHSMQAAIPILTWSIAKALQPPDRPALPPLGKNTTQWLLPSQCSRTSLQRRQVPTGIHSASLANIRRQAYSSTFNICIESHV